ncbi:MAG: hypothetical protein IKV44_06130 [Clostridia bacterium]|nr:hypothetical protein [Clostridia bacterium]
MADFDIGSILSSLSAEDMESIKAIAADFIGNKPAEQTKEQGRVPDLNSLQSLGLPDLSQLTAILPVLQEINKPDQRLDFINALKPMLSGERQQRADEAVKLVRLMSLLPLLRERGLM